jgi:hypothetical protein
LRSWTGGKIDNGDIVLFKDQKAPKGMDGYYRITFADIKEDSYEWVGSWVNKADTLNLSWT